MEYDYFEYKIFNKTKRCKAELHNMAKGEVPEAFLWVERGEDYYALMSPQLKGKRVAVIRREDWLRGEDVTTLSDY